MAPGFESVFADVSVAQTHHVRGMVCGWNRVDAAVQITRD